MRTEVDRLVSALAEAGIPIEAIALELYALAVGILAETRGPTAAAALCERTARSLRHGGEDYAATH